MPRETRLKYRKYLLGVVIASMALLLLWYPNRTVCEEDESWGKSCYSLRWGKGVKLTIDRDMNGRPEVVAIYSGEGASDAIYSHALPKEQWEDWDDDGRFERHCIYDEHELVALQLDTDGDGSYDKELLGEEAREYLRVNPWPGV